jgi:hypothetical protein
MFPAISAFSIFPSAIAFPLINLVALRRAAEAKSETQMEVIQEAIGKEREGETAGFGVEFCVSGWKLVH